MAHINLDRQVTERFSYSLSALMPQNQLPLNFAVFCGTADQRETIGLHAIQQCIGRVGVVFIHDDPGLADELNSLRLNGTNTQIFHPNRIISGGHLSYDPLYGLGKAAILNIVVPPSSEGYSTPAVDSIRARLADYLSIMEYQFSVSPEIFGNHPYNLDLLVQLTQMPYPVLEAEVLNYLPEHLRDTLRSRLSGEKVQQSVRDAVHKFQEFMSHYLWEPHGASRHTRISIYESVLNRNIISIYVPDSSTEVLDFLEQELQALTKARIPYFLMESGIDLSKSKNFGTRFLGEHSQLNYRTAILSSLPTSCISSDLSDFGRLTSQYHNVIVLNCSGSAEAELFSQATGTYYRYVTSSHRDRNRQPFHIFSSTTTGSNVAEQEERNIRANELTNMEHGALIFSKDQRQPLLISHFRLN